MCLGYDKRDEFVYGMDVRMGWSTNWIMKVWIETQSNGRRWTCMTEREPMNSVRARGRSVRSIVIQGFWIAMAANALIVAATFLSLYSVPRGSFVRPMGLACGMFAVWVSVLGAELVLTKDLIRAESNADSKWIAAVGLVALGFSPMVVGQCALHGFMWMWGLMASP